MDSDGLLDKAEFERRIAVLEEEKRRREPCYSRLMKISCIIAVPFIFFSWLLGFLKIFGDESDLLQNYVVYKTVSWKITPIIWGILAIFLVVLESRKYLLIIFGFISLYFLSDVIISIFQFLSLADGVYIKFDFVALSTGSMLSNYAIYFLFASIMACLKFPSDKTSRIVIFACGIVCIIGSLYPMLDSIWWYFYEMPDNKEIQDLILPGLIFSILSSSSIIAAASFSLTSNYVSNLQSRIKYLIISRNLGILTGIVLLIQCISFFFREPYIYVAFYNLSSFFVCVLMTVVLIEFFTRVAYYRWARAADAEISRMKQEISGN